MIAELRAHIIKLLDKGIRLDGRKALEYRPVKVTYDVTKSAEGSAQVQIGETKIIAGIKMAVETPYSDTPDQGNLMVGAELLPLANPKFETGAPGIQAIELGRVVDRGIRESKAIDVKKLCITPKEQVWSLAIDICPINDAGNLFDGSALAAFAALKNTKLPKLEDGVVNYEEKTKDPLPLSDKQPISVTVCMIGPHIIVDPSNEEEKVIDARLSVATTKNGEICALQKGGEYPLTIDEISKMMDIAIEKCKDLRKSL